MLSMMLIALLENEPPVVPNPDIHRVRCTCYLPTGNKTYDGTDPYYGVCASNVDHLGDVAILYSEEGEWIGFFECRDIGGNSRLKNGTGIDIFQYTMDDAWDWVGTWGDYVYVQWVEGVG